MSPDMVLALPAALWIALALLAVVAGGLVLYALRIKGDVSAEISHGTTTFRLEAKDRRPHYQEIRLSKAKDHRAPPTGLS
jgi:hypothetical protein